ncbi:response regulator transcription factor [Alkalimarinus sediminis]|uniref:Phosphate regulon transcriptional regulatory protein PhoB n=1 Tax=Alkalimarinus sediminis TaxID=1632866 RepID=A0A9E8HM39_9ALTE|nr:response regulator transcription factor [Alkalimarinus sediminis]UZW75183.1 response regulator transcription factor [Alkalimarinus sediminis]
MKRRILVIEDDPDINKLVSMNLRDMNYEVESCDVGSRGLQMAMSGHFDLIVLDVMLPEMDGLEICMRLRAAQQLMPILMLTAKDSEADRVVGLEMGADDYITKPFSVRELQARVKAMLRRVEMLTKKPVDAAPELLRFGGLEIDIAKRQVMIDQQPIELTSTEFDLLLYMARQPGLVFSRSQLLDKVWGYHHSGYEHTVNSHINRLRTKLEKDPSKPEYVLTVWGVGYKFADSHCSGH